ncbi:PREDICTED: FAD-linked sulfhydryl oxidase ALR-like [Amphimedon queenslandica]|uniref:Sulfhydryl oxidase n=1 Tax=Amphimedon queenslandica TaxID=400682 RepID=A0A1X7TZH6_AMPQE|nr:PREDICTED: FAD-linked sulfhydryl oxidase ALR-like [Amphimedon queenslandica]|eukprot:XP_019856908.1 PREDICTED: FAD-linked sulfhydryl oxidase ALR-like [Amphimedon queenslandica]
MADDTWQSKSSGKKPCRACTDFKTWSKQQKQNNTGQSSQSSSPKVTEEAPKPPADCPVDKDQLGRATWTFLHTMAAYYPEAPSTSQQQEMTMMMRTFSKYYPCDYCSHHMREW